MQRAYSTFYKLRKAFSQSAQQQSKPSESPPSSEGFSSFQNASLRIESGEAAKTDDIENNSAHSSGKPVVDGSDTSFSKNETSTKRVEEEVWGRGLNNVKEQKKAERAPLSDLYSKLADNMRASFLASQSSSSYCRLSLSKNSNKSKPKVKSNEQNVQDSSKSTENSVDSSHLENENLVAISQLSNNGASQSSVSESEVPFLECTDEFASPKYSIAKSQAKDPSYSVNISLYAAKKNSKFVGKIDNKWVERCTEKIIAPDEPKLCDSPDLLSGNFKINPFRHEPNSEERQAKLPTENDDSPLSSHSNDSSTDSDQFRGNCVFLGSSKEKKSLPGCLAPVTDENNFLNMANQTSAHEDKSTNEWLCDEGSREDEEEELTALPCGGKRKRVPTLEELEENETITPVWPPPKKKRVSRILKNSEEEIDRHRLNIKAQKLNLPSDSPKKCSSRVRVKSARQVKRTKKTEKLQALYEPSDQPTAMTIHAPEPSGEVVSMGSQNDGSAKAIPEYDEQVDMEKEKCSKFGRRRKWATKEDRLASKAQSGSLNDNFVKIDLKKKKFVRGGKGMTGLKYRRMEWKRKQGFKAGKFSRDYKSLESNSSNGLTCFKCGDFGHWASKCPGKMTEPTGFEEQGPISFLTLEEAADLAQGIKSSQSSNLSCLYPSQKPANVGQKEKGLSEETFDDEIIPKSDDESSARQEVPEKSVYDCIQDFQNESEDEEDYSGLSDYEKSANSDNEEDNESSPKADSSDSQDSGVACDSQGSTSSSIPNLSHFSSTRPSVDPLIQSDVEKCPQEVYDTLKMFGHSNFRAGQEKAILRILQGKNTLLVLSTGSGKSLCYQLPAYMYACRYNCLTLCVSPLVSLMEDQVTGLPPFLKAACLHTNLTRPQRDKTIQAVKEGRIHILLVSPEAVVASGAGGLLGTLMKDLPPIGFACVDEAHCVSQWSHNFRPSYLRVCRVLREQLGVRTILGLTATARYETTLNIADLIQVQDFQEGIITGSCVPQNLLLSASRDLNREQSLIQLLQGDRFGKCDSIIIYCTRRDECERVATLLRTQLLSADKIDVKANLKRNRALSLDAEAYHAGLSAYRRKQIQNKFMSGKIRIVVATVAFGMGIDKSDVRAIIHYNMPRNLESYVQEIGRAGRDGLESHCHVFLDNCDGRDVQELKRFIFVNSVDRVTVKKLVDKVFLPCLCAKGSKCPKHEIAVPICQMVESLDIPEENILTLLCYLELRDKNLMQLLPNVYGTCTVICYGGPQQLCSVSKTCPPLAVAIAKETQKGVDLQRSNKITFPVVRIASEMGWNSGTVKRELKSLEWVVAGGQARPSGVKVEFLDLSFHVMARGDLSDDERDDLIEALHSRSLQQERDELRQLQYTHQTLRASSHATILLCCDQLDQNRCDNLKAAIGRYFSPTEKELEKVVLERDADMTAQQEQRLTQDVRSLLSTHTDQTWTARAIARVFHGIQSPNFPANVWGRVRKIWRAHLDIAFKHILTVAQREIIKWRRL